MKVAELYASLGIRVDPQSLKKGERLIAGAKRAITKLSVAGVAMAGVAGKVISDVANMADEISKMSRKVGISVEKLQQLEFAAQLSGTSLQVMRTGLQRFARTADDANQGLASAIEPFERMGIAVKDSNGQLKDLDSLLLEAADAFRGMPDGTEKTALAMKTFGRAGAELIPLLNEGSAGIEKMRAEFASMGAQISTSDAKAFEEYNDTVLRVKTALIGFRNQAVVALLPYLKSASKALLAWVKANKDMIKQNMAKVMKVLFFALKSVAKILGFVLKHGEKLLRFYVSWRLAILAVAAAQKIMALGSIAAALKVAAAWALAAAPLVLMALLIGLVALAIEDFISFLQGKDSLIGRAFEAVADTWIGDVGRFFAWFFRKVDELASYIPRKLKGALRTLPGVGGLIGGGPASDIADIAKEVTRRNVSSWGDLSFRDMIGGGAFVGPLPDRGTSNTTNITQNIQGSDPFAVGREAKDAIVREMELALP